MKLMAEANRHAERSRYYAADAVRDLQRGQLWLAENAMKQSAMERHLAYEKWDTAEIAYAALKECWASRG